MNKIGILTFHRAVNYGAVLQAYALQKFMNTKGIETEVIDYYNKKINKEYCPFKLELRHPKRNLYNLIMFKERYKRKKKFYTFINKYIRLSGKKYSKKNIASVDNQYSKICVGSDQVWNLELSGNDTTYLLDFCHKASRYSYAASIGKMQIGGEEKEIFRENLEKYKAISLREKTAENCLKNIVNKDMQIVVDPTMLLTKKEWEEVSINPQIKEKYILVYKITESKSFEYALKLSKKKGIKVVVLQAPHRHISTQFCARRYDSPEEWIGWIKNAEYVVTDSFHATVFSIIFEKKFVAMEGYNSGGHKNERISNLLNTLELQSKSLVDIDLERIDEQIEYTEVKRKLDKVIDKSEKYVYENLK